MLQNQFGALSIEAAPALLTQVTLEYIRRNGIPWAFDYCPHVPTIQQLKFIELMCRDAFYGGAAGGGKSDALLMAALQFVHVPGYNALLIRNTYKNLTKSEGLINRSHEWLQNTDAHWYADSPIYGTSVWMFPSGATVGFGYLDGPLDEYQYQGPAYQFVGIDEVVQIRKEQALYVAFSRCRRLARYENVVPLRFRCASNPPTRKQLIRGRWVKERYVDSEDRPFIPASLEDNPYLDMESYDGDLKELGHVAYAQLRHGDWEIKPTGRMIERSWFETVDEVPSDAKRVRSWDWAATKKVKETDEPCWTVGTKISRTSEGFIFIEDVADIQENPARVELLVMNTASADGQAVPIRGELEPGASGKSHINNYQRNVVPMYDFKGLDVRSGDKETRLRPFINQAEAGNVFIKRASWNERVLDALEALPDAGWDYADSISLGYNFLAGLDKAPARVRVIDSGRGTTGKVREVENTPTDDMVPVYWDGRCIGYEPAHSAENLEVLNLLSVYENGKLVRYDRTARPYGARKRGLS